MATKTLILRPNSVIEYNGTITAVPSDTTTENWYKLVNEEVSDGDSTVIQYPADTTSSVTFGYDFIRMGNILSAKIYAVHKSGTALKQVIASLQILDNKGTLINSEELIKDITISNASTYYTTVLDVNIYDSLNSINSGTLSVKHAYGSGNKAITMSSTQFYIEIEYEEGEIPTPSNRVFRKVDGIWIEYQTTFYEKQNGEWVLTDSSILQNGDKFIIKEVN